MDPVILSGILGGLGGFVRGLVGVSKALTAGKKILLTYYLATVLTAVGIGIFVGAIFNINDERLSLLAGYAGTDVLEGVYKSFTMEKVILRTKR